MDERRRAYDEEEEEEDKICREKDYRQKVLHSVAIMRY